MLLDISQPGFRSLDAQVRRPAAPPEIGALEQGRQITGPGEAAIHANRRRVAAGDLRSLCDGATGGIELRPRRDSREPAVCGPGDTPIGGVRASADPDRYRSARARREAQPVNTLELAAVVNSSPRPQRTQQLDLL